MNVLLVDDNRFVIHALEQKIDWSSLGVDQVISSSNIIHAQEIFHTHSIDLLICDIEMPEGSGLELLAWIREKEFNTQVIFLTSYADFNYAQKAIELQSFDYFLKPIAFDKLTVIIHKAIVKIKEERKKMHELAEKELLWHDSQKQLHEAFWYKIITGKIFPSISAISKAMHDHYVSYTENDYFLPVLIHAFSIADFKSHVEDAPSFENALMNIITEVCEMLGYPLEIPVSCVTDDTWIAILKMTCKEENPDIFFHMCDELINRVAQRLSVEVRCSIGKICHIQMIHQIYMQLLDMDNNVVNNRKKVLLLADYNHKSINYFPPNLELIETLLKQLDSGSLHTEIERYLKQLMQQGFLTTHVLQLFRMDITQLIYSFLKSNGVPAHKLIFDSNNTLTFDASRNSVDDIMAYITDLIDTTIKLYHAPRLPQTIVEKIKGYIIDHYAEDLSRNKLADLFYLNPDYLSRLFTRETGVSLINYITQIRIDKAKELLRDTDEPIHYIASSVGYGNYSHFSKIFKECCGYSPKDYRKNAGLLI